MSDPAGKLPGVVNSHKKSDFKQRCAATRAINSKWKKIKVAGAEQEAKGDMTVMFIC